MNKKTTICKICNCEIRNQEPRFYFPILPQWHDLSDLSQNILHVHCVKSIDSEREIGNSLARIVQDLAEKSKWVPFMHRDGNIVLRARLDEERIEILDFEDFCEISIPKTIVKKLQILNSPESINIGLNTLHILKDGNLRIESSLFTLDLSELNYLRLINLLNCAKIETFFEDSRC